MTLTNGPIDYVLFSDTNCGVDDKTSRACDIQLISFPIRVNDVDYYPYSHRSPFDFKAFFDDLRKTDRVYTWKLTADNYKEYFIPFLEKGKDIVYIHFSHFGTNTFEFDLPMAIKELKEKYPNRVIDVFDSRSVAQGALPLVISTAKERLKGKTRAQIGEYIRANVGKRIAYFIPENLSYLSKYGKVSGVASFLGNSFGVRPIMEANVSGDMNVVAKFVGRDMSLSKRILLRMKTEGYPVGDKTGGKIDIGYTDNEERGRKFIESFAEMAQKMKMGPFVYELSRIDPHHSGIIGPGAIGLAYTTDKTR